MHKLSFLLLFIVIMPLKAQEELSENDFVHYVLSYHPYAKIAGMTLDKARFEVRAARGGFDPKVYGEIDEKNFKGTNYYDIQQYGLKVPTWFGAEFKTTYETVDGVYYNPERNVPDDGLTYLGLSLPVGQGLFIDQRKFDLRYAQILKDRSSYEQINQYNTLLSEALEAYWDWVYAYYLHDLFKETVELNEDRLKLIREGFYLGDNAGMDTLETYVQYQSNYINYQEAEYLLNTNRMAASNYMWFENEVPLVISEDTRPPTYDSLHIILEIRSLSHDSLIPPTHPVLKMYEAKIEAAELKARLKGEKLKPKINLEYGLIQSGFAYDKFEFENQKWGLNFSMPLLLRQERGERQLAQLEVMQANLKYSQKRLELENKLKSARQNLKILADQLELYQNILNNYSKLLENEQVKFSLGDGSIFYINTREQKLLNAYKKYYKVLTKTHFYYAQYKAIRGDLYSFEMKMNNTGN